MRATLRAIAVALIVLGPVAALAAEADIDQEELASIRELLRSVPLIDGHNDAPYAIRHRFENCLEQFDFHDTSAIEDPMQTDIERLRAGGVGGQFWSVWVPMDLDGGEAVVQVLEQIDLVHRLVARYPEDLELALTAADIRRIHGNGRIACLIGLEGGHSIAGSPAVLRQLYAVGARYMTLTHWDNIAWVDAGTDAPEHDGLTPWGESLVREMNRIGMLVDLSHVSAPAMHDALDASRAPVIFSHSSALAINPHPRNVPDEVLRRMPANGGVVMVNFGSFFVSPAVVERNAAYKAEKTRLENLHPGDPDRVEQSLEQWLDVHPMPRVTVADLADHIDHVRQLAGVDHVGLGSDFDGVSSLPEGVEDVSGYPVLLAELGRRGWNRDELAKLAGLNLLRAMGRAERVATELRGAEQPFEERLGDGPAADHHD